jgi:DNA protecting protein DprA
VKKAMPKEPAGLPLAEGTVSASPNAGTLGQWPARERMLWYRGDLQLLQRPMISVVGSRDPSDEGRRRAARVARDAVASGWVVVSGLASGIDTVAHTTTLELGGSTVAVLGTPIDRCYPKENKPLKQSIESRGLVLSQFAPGTPTKPGHFPARNVLMAAMSWLTVVVEASATSGTRHQVHAAVRLGRVVGFLNSLAERDYPWIQEAFASGLGRTIKQSEDLAAAFDEARSLVAPKGPPGQMDLFGR